MTGPLRLGIVGAGAVCDHYLPNLAVFPDVDVRIIGDHGPERAARRAEAFDIPRSGDAADVIRADDVEAVLNLTPPAAHLPVAVATLAAGKHLYSEKPLATDLASAQLILQTAAEQGLVVGSAPDVSLGPAFQASLRLLNEGGIGTPVFARCEAVLAGPESWHPRPQFLFARGGGPLFDIGPYYLTALVAALGRIRWVSARGSRKALVRTVGSGPLAGQEFPVEVPTLVTAILGLASGVCATLLLTFDSASHRGGWMEVLGTTGTLRTPDPNGAVPDAAVLPSGQDSWVAIPAEGSPRPLGQGIVNFARHIRGQEPLVTSGVRAMHVVEVMTAIATSADSGSAVSVETNVPNSPLLPADWDPTQRTL